MALEFHEAALAPVREALGPDAMAAAAEWARSGTPESRAREILAELDALIAATAAAGAGEEEHPPASP